MSTDRRRILALLEAGKITTDEAERLLSALERTSGTEGPAAAPMRRAPKYLRVQVDADRPDRDPTQVNIRVPMSFLRAGVRLNALMTPAARDEVNEAMARKGMKFDINQLKPENLEELITQLDDFTIDVDNGRTKVKLYCE